MKSWRLHPVVAATATAALICMASGLIQAPVSAGTPTQFVFTSPTGTAVADGSATLTCSVTALDSSNNPVSGVHVDWVAVMSDGGGLYSADSTTDVSGVATSTWTDDVPESFMVQATNTTFGLEGDGGVTFLNKTNWSVTISAPIGGWSATHSMTGPDINGEYNAPDTGDTYTVTATLKKGYPPSKTAVQTIGTVNCHNGGAHQGPWPPSGAISGWTVNNVAAGSDYWIHAQLADKTGLKGASAQVLGSIN